MKNEAGQRLVVITDGAYKNSIGASAYRDDATTTTVDIGGTVIQKSPSQLRPLELGDVIQASEKAS